MSNLSICLTLVRFALFGSRDPPTNIRGVLFPEPIQMKGVILLMPIIKEFPNFILTKHNFSLISTIIPPFSCRLK